MVALPLERFLSPHPWHHGERLAQLVARRIRVDLEGFPLGSARTREAELETTAAHVVEERRAFGDPQRMVDIEGRKHTGVSEPDPLCVLRDHREHHLGRRAVRELGRAVVLDGPPAAEAQLVRELRLLDGISEDPCFEFAVGGGTRRHCALKLREYVENQGRTSSPHSTGMTRPRPRVPPPGERRSTERRNGEGDLE